MNRVTGSRTNNKRIVNPALSAMLFIFPFCFSLPPEEDKGEDQHLGYGESPQVGQELRSFNLVHFVQVLWDLKIQYYENSDHYLNRKSCHKRYVAGIRHRHY